jgi:iron(III) transport system substrate-binding protein
MSPSLPVVAADRPAATGPVPLERDRAVDAGPRRRPGRRAGRRPGRVAALVALAAIGASLAACSSSTSSTATAAAKEPTVPLVVYAAEGYDQAEVNAFQAATGIPTELVDHSTGTLLAKIQAEGDHPQWGLFWSDGNAAYAALDQEHMLVRGFEPDTGHLTALGKKLVPKDESYIPTGLTVAGAIVYNSQTVTDPPTSWTQLTEPEWNGAVGMNNPAISGPTYSLVAGIMQQLGGVGPGERFFSKLAADHLHVYPTNKVTLTALLQGQIKLAIVQNSAGIGFEYQYPQLRVAYPRYVTDLPSVIGIDAKVSKAEQAEAERFADFVYSKKGQQVMLSGDPHGDSLFFPIIEGTAQHKLVPPLSSIPLQFISPTVWGAREGTINQWFTANVVNG